MLRLLILAACGTSVFAEVGDMAVINVYGALGTSDTPANSVMNAGLLNAQCLDPNGATTTDDVTLCSTGHASTPDYDANKDLATCEALGTDCIWAPTCMEEALTNAEWATHQVSMDTSFVKVRKAFPIADATATTAVDGMWWKTGNAGMYNLGLPFADGTSNTQVLGPTVTVPVYGIFTISSGTAPAITLDLTTWATSEPAGNATTGGDKMLGVWQCQDARTAAVGGTLTANQNLLMGTGAAVANSGVSTVKGSWVKISKHAADTDCSDAADLGTAGGVTYEKVAMDAGQTVSSQASCVQSGAATSYSFTCLDNDIIYTTHANSNTCGGTPTVSATFTQAVKCQAPSTDSSNGWKINATKAEWDAVCGFEHGSATSKAVAVQLQSVVDGSTGTTTVNIANQISTKLFPISNVDDRNFTGQLASSDFKLENMGLPFGTKMAQELIGTGVDDDALYLMWGIETGETDVTLSFFSAMPPSQAFVPAAASKWESTDVASPWGPIAMAVTGGTEDDGSQNNGSLAVTAGWQNTGVAAGNQFLTSGYAENDSSKAVVVGLKYVTMFEVADCAAATKVYTKQIAATTTAQGTPFYYRRTYEFVALSDPTTLAAGCINTSQTVSYAFTCAAATQSIVYTTYAAKDCAGEGTVGATFTKAAKCKDPDTNAAGNMWEIQNSDSDWDDICTEVTPAPTAGAPSSAPGSAVSDAATVATAAALAAGAAALIL